MFGQEQAFWHPIQKDMSPMENTAESTVFPETRRAFDLQFEDLSNSLRAEAPAEFSGQPGFLLELPLPDRSATFEVYYSPVVETPLQDKYPDIRSYKGFNVDDPTEVMRMTISHLGLKASILTSNGEVYIDPFIEGQTTAHAAYYVKDYDHDLIHEALPHCGNNDFFENPVESFEIDAERSENLGLRSAGDPINLRTFRTAIATTGEWTVAEGGKTNAVAKVIACVDRGNQIFENEVGFRLILIGNNDNIVYADPTTDPYPGSEPKSGRELIGMNTLILNTRIGTGNYDIGHIFTNRCSDVGGVASLASVCGGNKGSGTTCWYNRNLQYTVVRIMCHEMGHQFSAPHTFNNCGGNESGATAYEPGSGSTIMSYGGLCGANNVVSGGSAARDITYYHANSLMRLFTFSRFISCGSEIQTSNTRPEAALNYENDFYIPVSTPFVLEGEGIDMEEDPLTYCFEQLDFSAKQCPLGDPVDDCPLFRSFPPHDEDYRVFPKFSTIWTNQIAQSITEVLPDYSREINFVLTVRDNNPEAGGYGMDTLTFNSTDKAGPFLVQYPNSGEDQITGTYMEVRWDVANTHLPPVNCENVDILIYYGPSWENHEILKFSTANDGSEWIKLPDEIRGGLKIMVRAADNIFFDISDRSFSLEQATSPGFVFGLTPNSGRVCLPDIFTTEILSSAFGGYNGQLELDIVEGLPNEATYSFDDPVIDASQNTMLRIDLSELTSADDLEIKVRAISTEGDTLIRQIDLDIVKSDYSSLDAVYPPDGLQGVEQSPELEWPDIPDADYYNVQLATNPSFDDNSIIAEWYGVSENSVKLQQLLNKNNIFYWRVQAGNVCQLSDFIRPAAFSTEAASCVMHEGPDRSVRLQPDTRTEFGLNIFQNAAVNDINVSHIDFFCDFLQDAKLSLMSPAGTEVVLFENQCGNTTVVDCSFDDDAPRSIKCPPINKQAYRPVGNLTDFNGEDAQGKWNLVAEISRNAASAELLSWELELCANVVLDAPVLVTNDTMKTRPSEKNPISSTLLQADDNNNGPNELEYIITETPSEGVLYLNDNPVQRGMTFTQSDLNDAQVSYDNVTGEEGIDDFSFTVNDGEGGWTGTHRFVIALDNDFASSVNDRKLESFYKLFPNPNNGQFTIYLNGSLHGPTLIEVTDLKGSVLERAEIAPGDRILKLDLSDVVDGIYLVKAFNADVYFSERVLVSRR